jgi:hypothetical protein
MADRGCHLNGSLSVYNRKSLTIRTIVDNMFIECYPPSMLKTSFVDLEKE